MSRPLKRICVFCGSSNGSHPKYREIASNLGRRLAERGIVLIYGGAHVGLMGAVADAALAAGGEAIGVIPKSMVDREIAHTGLSELRVVRTMHERKQLMADLSDGFLAMPGGFGTFEEFCEIVTWGVLGIHRKPCGLLNSGGYYDPLLRMFDRGVEEGFIRPAHRDMVLSADDADVLIDRMIAYEPVVTRKWIDIEES